MNKSLLLSLLLAQLHVGPTPPSFSWWEINGCNRDNRQIGNIALLVICLKESLRRYDDGEGVEGGRERESEILLTLFTSGNESYFDDASSLNRLVILIEIRYREAVCPT